MEVVRGGRSRQRIRPGYPKRGAKAVGRPRKLPRVLPGGGKLAVEAERGGRSGRKLLLVNNELAS